MLCDDSGNILPVGFLPVASGLLGGKVDQQMPYKESLVSSFVLMNEILSWFPEIVFEKYLILCTCRPTCTRGWITGRGAECVVAGGPVTLGTRKSDGRPFVLFISRIGADGTFTSRGPESGLTIPSLSFFFLVNRWYETRKRAPSSHSARGLALPSLPTCLNFLGISA